MDINNLIKKFEANRDHDNAIKQEAYLKNQFKFLGLPKPKRSLLEKEFVKESKQLAKEEIIDLVFALCDLEYREYLYTAQMILQANYQKFNYDDIQTLSAITLQNQWWENTDGFQSFLKKWFRANPGAIRQFVLDYYKHENMWMRRLAIIAQLGLKEQTDAVVLKRAIRYNMKYDEFFIQKAIGWALREYSKYNVKEVTEFIAKNEMKLSNLAIREGSKYI